MVLLSAAVLTRTDVQVDLARSLLEEHAFQEVVWTDTDVVWLRSPLAFLAEHPSADIAVQTDCLSHAVEATFTGPLEHRFARCGHLPGNAHNNAFNTGMLVLRNRAATRAFLAAWLAHLLDGSRMFADLGGGRTAVVGDQLALNRLMTAGSQPWVSVNATADWRVVWAHEQQVKARPPLRPAAACAAHSIPAASVPDSLPMAACPPPLCCTPSPLCVSHWSDHQTPVSHVLPLPHARQG